MIEGCEPWGDGSVQPNCAYTLAVPVLGPRVYGRVKEIIEHTVGSSLIYLNSYAADFKNPQLRGFLDQYLRGSDGYASVDRAKVMKLLRDALGSEFGGRHELYERNYAGNSEDTRRMVLSSAVAGGAPGGSPAWPSSAWPSTTSTAGRSPGSSTRTTSACGESVSPVVLRYVNRPIMPPGSVAGGSMGACES
jgi:hypothetical protein